MAKKKESYADKATKDRKKEWIYQTVMEFKTRVYKCNKPTTEIARYILTVLSLNGLTSKIYPLDTFGVPFTNGHQTQAKPLVTELSSPHKVDELFNVTSVCARSSRDVFKDGE
jgi:hypothetical protein